MSHSAVPNARTTIWQNTPNGLALLRTIPGLPYGTASKVFIDGLGEARQTGRQTTGSGRNEAIVEIKYTLIQ